MHGRSPSQSFYQSLRIQTRQGLFDRGCKFLKRLGAGQKLLTDNRPGSALNTEPPPS